MLKEVGASGQISLGKRYAGKLFDMVVSEDGRIELVPMKAVPALHRTGDDAAGGTAVVASEHVAEYRVGDGWLTPERLARRRAAAARSPEETERLARQWEEENKEAIDSMNERYAAFGSMGRRIYEWRKAKADRTATGQRRA